MPAGCRLILFIFYLSLSLSAASLNLVFLLLFFLGSFVLSRRARRGKTPRFARTRRGNSSPTALAQRINTAAARERSRRVAFRNTSWHRTIFFLLFSPLSLWHLSPALCDYSRDPREDSCFCREHVVRCCFLFFAILLCPKRLGFIFMLFSLLRLPASPLRPWRLPACPRRRTRGAMMIAEGGDWPRLGRVVG